MQIFCGCNEKGDIPFSIADENGAKVLGDEFECRCPYCGYYVWYYPRA